MTTTRSLTYRIDEARKSLHLINEATGREVCWLNVHDLYRSDCKWTCSMVVQSFTYHELAAVLDVARDECIDRGLIRM